jgi:hypothetical protein
VKPDTITTPALVAALRVRYPAPEYAFLEQVRSQTGYSSTTRTADALAMSLWPSRGLELHGFEIKVSRGDWLREKKEPAKAEEILRYCDRWWLVVADAEIVKPGELPPTWGLIVPRGKGLVAKVEAPKLEAEPLTRAIFAAILRNVDTAKQGMLPRDELDIALDKAREEGRAKALAEGNVARELRMAKTKLEALETTIEKFKAASGIEEIDRWNAGHVGEAVKLIMAAGLGDAFDQMERMQQVWANMAKTWGAESKDWGKKIADERAKMGDLEPAEPGAPCATVPQCATSPTP